jgi:hypothetical protein
MPSHEPSFSSPHSSSLPFPPHSFTRPCIQADFKRLEVVRASAARGRGGVPPLHAPRGEAILGGSRPRSSTRPRPSIRSSASSTHASRVLPVCILFRGVERKDVVAAAIRVRRRRRSASAEQVECGPLPRPPRLRRAVKTRRCGRCEAAVAEGVRDGRVQRGRRPCCRPCCPSGTGRPADRPPEGCGRRRRRRRRCSSRSSRRVRFAAARRQRGDGRDGSPAH